MGDRTALARPFGAAFVLGFALSGFFDGILLHQILQWHHLLSLVDAEAMRGLRAQVLADGLFHALMYVIAGLGLAMLWGSRAGLAAPGGSRRLGSGVLIGFGAWNVVDIGLFHWILNLHRVRLDVTDPLAWDLGWLVVLGLVPLAAGWAVARRGSSPGSGGPVHASVLVLALAVSGTWSLRPPPAKSDTLVVFRPGADMMSAVAAVDARIVDLRPEQSLAVLRLPDEGAAWRLYRHGAILVQGAGPAGCLNFARPPLGPDRP